MSGGPVIGEGGSVLGVVSYIRVSEDGQTRASYAVPVPAGGPLISRLHIKDFKIDREKKNEGDFVPIGKGSVDWVSVRKVIDEVGYNGWVSIESGGFTDDEHSAIMDRFFAGKGA